MADFDEAKSVESEYDSDAENFFALRWTARRFEASDDESAGEEDKEKYRWSCVSLPRDESDGGEGSSSEFYDELEGVGSVGEELELLSQEGGEEKVQETVRRVNKEKAKENAVSDEVSVPRTGSFYMHDDRFLSGQYRTRRGAAMIGKKLWERADGSKWKHDKFEDMTYKGAPKSNGRQQWKNRTKGHRYADTNQFGSLDNYGNQNNKTSRMVKGRGTVKYKPIVKSNNLNLSPEHQIPAKLKERTTSFCSSQLSSQKTYQPYPIQENRRNDNGFPLPPLRSQQLRHPCNEYHQTSFKYLAANSSIETLPQTTSLGHDLVGRGSFKFGGSPALSPVIQHGGLPCDAVDDHAPSMALARRHAGLSQLGSTNGGKARYSKVR